MATLTEFVAAVVVHSTAAAFSHFGVPLEPAHVEKKPAPAERVVARSQPRRLPVVEKQVKPVDCTETRPDLERV